MYPILNAPNLTMWTYPSCYFKLTPFRMLMSNLDVLFQCLLCAINCHVIYCQNICHVSRSIENLNCEGIHASIIDYIDYFKKLHLILVYISGTDILVKFAIKLNFSKLSWKLILSKFLDNFDHLISLYTLF